MMKAFVDLGVIFVVLLGFFVIKYALATLVVLWVIHLMRIF